MTFQRHEVNLERGVVNYYKDGSGRPLLYLHSGEGLLESKPLQSLAKQFEVFVPLIPGYGQAPNVEGVSSVPDLAELWSQFIDEAIGESLVDVVGNSLGGYVASWLAANYPEKIDQLVLIGPYGLNSLDVEELSEHPEKRVKEVYKYPNKLADIQLLEASIPTVLNPSYSNTHFDQELLDKMKGVDKLTLVLLGTDDAIVMPQVGHLLKEKMPRAHFIYVYDAGHGIEIDQPERVATVLTDFLSRGEAFIVNWGGRAEEEAPVRE